MRVWVTRAEPGAGRTAGGLVERGVDPLVAPLLRLQRLTLEPGEAEAALAGAAALAFTSRAGVEAFGALTTVRDLPVFAVGDATAEAARAAGWAKVESADGDAAALADLMAASTPGVGAVLAPGAREPAFDLVGALQAKGIAARALPLYASAPADAPPPPVVKALAEGVLDGLLLHSPAAARALAACASADAAFAHALRPLKAYALSPACAAPVSGLFVRPPACAQAPRERDLLALLRDR